jgi:threonine dehydrogenase-like Zn-dependent dehydrogenase
MNAKTPAISIATPADDTLAPFKDRAVFDATYAELKRQQEFETWYKMASLLQSGLHLEQIITHHLPVQDYLHGFETMGSGQSRKVILDWSTL